MNKKIVAVDFDGTIIQWQKDAHLLKEFILMPNVKQVLDWMYQNFFCILWTCRENEPLQNALSFLARTNIKFHAINQNAPFVDFDTSAKIYFDFAIDDRCWPKDINWLEIKQFLQDKFLSTEEIIIDKVLIEVK
jgi:hydroxymethylpyrimidine pyrophosphatase-like HAD family hydrolase